MRFLIFIVFVSACAFKLPNASLGVTTPEVMRMFDEQKKLPPVPVFDGDIFMIFAHADDELLTLAYVAKVRKLYPEKAIHWILVSNSGKGLIIPTACGVKDAITCRREEAQKAATCVGIDSPYELSLNDGKVAEVKNLSKLLEKTIAKLTVKKVGLVLTHDVTGVYGHSDHIAVHDALAKLAKAKKWPLLTTAIPPEFRKHIPQKGEGKNRVDVPITHIVELDETLKKQMTCAIEAHDSQKFLLWLMRRFMDTEGYLDRVPLQFFNLSL